MKILCLCERLPGFSIYQMRLKITFDSDIYIRVPIHYNYQVQSLIYRHLDKALARNLHDEGIPHEKRRYKFFTFSRLFSLKREKDGRYWILHPPITFYISAININILESLANHLVKQQSVEIGNESLYINSIEVIKEPEYTEETIIKVLSPITVYSTFRDNNGKKKTYYYNPHESEFGNKLRENLRRKFVAIYSMEPEEEDDIFRIEPVKVGFKNEVIAKYKGTIIKGWTGIYKIKTSKAYFHIAYNAGLGSKNSQGFGMIDVIKKKIYRELIENKM